MASPQDGLVSMAGNEHGHWDVFTDDPYWMRRLEKLGIEPVKVVVCGRQYRLTADQVLIRKGKRAVSDASGKPSHRMPSLGLKFP